jgi:hypothetical protein
MYIAIDEYLLCSKHGHGKRVRGAIHLFVEGGDINNPRHTWLVCLNCARRMDRDRFFKASSRFAFEEYQQHMSEVLSGESPGRVN